MIIIKQKIINILKIFIIFVSAIILSIGGLYLYAFVMPKIPIKTNGKFYIYDGNNNLVYQGSSSSEWVNLDDINDNFKNAIIYTEDKNFYNHQGFDYLRIGKAVINNIKNKKVLEGASTISQQYVKNMYLTFDKTWSRKYEEALLTVRIETHYSKDEILEGYLNTINFGEGNYGIASASEYYFNKKPSELTLEEACILAGIPKSPSNYNPVSNYKKSVKRAKVVAYNLYKRNIISKKEYKSLFKSEVGIYGQRTKNNLNTLMYYQDAVISELNQIDKIPNSLIKSGGLKIYTALDMDAQTNIENAINNNMKDDTEQVASLYINPLNGEVKALVGGKNYNYSEFNRITQSKRQVGSTIKPFLYYSALSNGMTMASTFDSEPTTFSLSNNNFYSPSNYNDIYANKKITMAAALALSDNVYAVKTHLFLGEDSLVNTLNKCGLKENLSNIPSLALGTIEMNMLDYAKAYTTLASGGYERNVHLIRKVEDIDGNVLYTAKETNDLVLNYNYVYILNEMMRNTYNPNFIDYNSPTAISIKGAITRKYAIKTGTTDNDHWIIGYNPNGLLMVWCGTDNNNYSNSGYSKITKNIWVDTIENNQKDLEDTWYEQPKNIVAMPLAAISGIPDQSSKNAIYYFVRGTEPN